MLPDAMPQRNFGRSVARAAASGGGKAYRARPAVGWYLTMFLIVLVGVSLIVYSRQEALHPHVASQKTSEGPTATDRWHAAISFSVCGVTLKALPANTNLSTTGLRTFGDGLIYIQPGVVSSNAKAFEGANATLATFVAHYPGLALSSTSLTIPGAGSFKNGDLCSKVAKNATPAQRAAATGSVRIETWSSPTAKGKVLAVANPSAIHLTNGEMISVGFLTPSEKLPVPPSKSALIAILGTTTTSTSSTTTTSTSSTTSTT
ncbi:MAG TPA: hypothetical protein VG368_02315 [Acidimicrobiales bacterium]|jgi:hypothetical protein|nr:hypothetical protein [Acidimicrobiales bacterium]